MKISYNKKTLKLLVTIFHLGLFFIYWFYLDSFPEALDAKVIFTGAKKANNWLDLLGLGTTFLSFLIYPLTYMGLGFKAISLLFSLISLKGYFIYIDCVFNKKIKEALHYYVALLLLFTPSMHFWTNLISKEAIIFLLMALTVKKIIQNNSFSFFIYFSIILSVFIRPYLGLSLVVSYYMYLSTNLSRRKFSFYFKAAIVFCLLMLAMKKFTRMADFSKESIVKVYSNISKYALEHGSSSINLEESNYLERVLLLLTRPIFFDAKTVFQYIISIENALYVCLYVLIFGCFLRIKNKMFFLKQNIFILGTVTFVILLVSTYIYNLGLASRMRIMFLPYLLLLFLQIFVCDYIIVNKASENEKIS